MALAACLLSLGSGCGWLGIDLLAVQGDQGPDAATGFNSPGSSDGSIPGPGEDASTGPGDAGGASDASSGGGAGSGGTGDEDSGVDPVPAPAAAQCTAANQASVCGGLPCVDGYCCESLCDGVCEACNLTGSQGICAMVPNGDADPLTGSSCDGDDADLCSDDSFGSCSAGALSCSSGADNAELCDGMDNDCDAATADGSDEATFGNACDGADADMCQDGSLACNGTVLFCNDGPGVAPDLCDGIDNDCNPATPDGSDEATFGNACDGTDTDLCEEGSIACNGSSLFCTDSTGSTTDVCDGADNDCNPATSDGSAEATFGNACDGPDLDLCDEGSIACDGSVLYCSDVTANTPEICGSGDNDCDGATDEDGQALWWNASWSYRNKLEFLNGAQNLALSNLPVMVRLTPDNFSYARAEADGTDLRFISDDHSTVLPYHIERWNVGGVSTVWVNVDVIDASSDTDHMWMYYGNGSAPDVTDSAATFAGYSAVYHLQESSRTTGAHNDHDNAAGGGDAEAGNFAIGDMNPTVSGRIGGANDFDGVDDFVEGDNSVADNIFQSGATTISAWIYPRSWGENNFGRIMDKSNDSSASRGWSFQLDNGNATASIRFEVGFDGTQGGWLCPDNSIQLNTWQHVAATYSATSAGNNATIYVNGVSCNASRAQSPSGAWQSDASYRVRFGGRSGNTDRAFNGLIDEVRLGNGSPRSAQWIAADALSHANNFVRFVDEEIDSCP